MRLVLLCGALLALASPARAQGTRGFFLNGHLLWASLSGENRDTGEDFSDDGPGLGFRAGYGFSERIGGYVALEGASIFPDENAGTLEDERFGLGMVELGARFNFPAGRKIVPYAEAALAAHEVRFDFVGTTTDLRVRGGGLTLGGGLQYFLSRTLALDAGLDLTFGRFTEAEFDGPDADVSFDLEDTDATIARLNLGLSLWPSRR